MQLIPKVEHLKFAVDLCPIALCNVLYKILAKLLTNNLKPILWAIIDQSQGVFVASRGVIDNAILVFKTIHSILKNDSRITSAHKNMAINIDMSETYDKINWEFLEFILNKFIFPRRFVCLIMRYVSSSSIAILVNVPFLILSAQVNVFTR